MGGRTASLVSAGSRRALRGAGVAPPLDRSWLSLSSLLVPRPGSLPPSSTSPAPSHVSLFPPGPSGLLHPHPFPTTSPPPSFQFPHLQSTVLSTIPIPMFFRSLCSCPVSNNPQHHSSLCVPPSAPPYAPLPILSPTAPLYHSSLCVPLSQSLSHVLSPDPISDFVSHVQEPRDRHSPASPQSSQCPACPLVPAEGCHCHPPALRTGLRTVGNWQAE